MTNSNNKNRTEGLLYFDVNSSNVSSAKQLDLMSVLVAGKKKLDFRGPYFQMQFIFKTVFKP